LPLVSVGEHLVAQDGGLQVRGLCSAQSAEDEGKLQISQLPRTHPDSRLKVCAQEEESRGQLVLLLRQESIRVLQRCRPPTRRAEVVCEERLELLVLNCLEQALELALLAEGDEEQGAVLGVLALCKLHLGRRVQGSTQCIALRNPWRRPAVRGRSRA